MLTTNLFYATYRSKPDKEFFRFVPYLFFVDDDVIYNRKCGYSYLWFIVIPRNSVSLKNGDCKTFNMSRNMNLSR